MYLTSLALKKSFSEKIWVETVFDTFNMILLASYLLMYVGITASITKAYKAHCRQKSEMAEMRPTNINDEVMNHITWASILIDTNS